LRRWPTGWHGGGRPTYLVPLDAPDRCHEEPSNEIEESGYRLGFHPALCAPHRDAAIPVLDETTPLTILGKTP
jgi:hypothetical protein